jgi:hypothetical protein
MATFIAWGVWSLICWVTYRYGQQIGSRLGYRVGRIHGRRCG